MILLGEKFICHLPSEEELLIHQSFTYPDEGQMAARINAMPCLLWTRKDWTYIVCPYYVFQIHNQRYVRNNLGTQYTDHYVKKKLQGFWGETEQTYFTRNFANGSACGLFGDHLATNIRFFCRQSKDEGIFFVQRITPCMYEIHIYTPRVCTGLNFESITGHSVQCHSNTDAMALVLAKMDHAWPTEHKQIFEFQAKVPKNDIKSIFFIMNSNIPPNDMKKPPILPSKKFCKKSLTYRAEEILSASMGIPFDFSVAPQNRSSDFDFLYMDLMNLVHSDALHSRAIFDLHPFHSLAEELKKTTLSSKNKKKKKKEPSKKVNQNICY
ncbi:uncharacterized protein CEXT_305381 [Caerostris extrusa]|uniref:MRH domain-containing protein n=1 Tax=Caerostris extrusa TaxID=172846 RepID=A0AAV4P8Y1_CAEEX|nr:uncharacterized protein CEXT_305381 [Caerostris extrusa]